MNLRDLVYPVFHPVVDINGVPIYYEATLRAYGQRTADGHGRLLAVAEEMGFIDMLDCFICEAAIETAMSSGCAVGVNVSAFTVQNSLEEFLRVASRGRSLPGGLVIELTETVQPDRMDLMDQFVTAARRLRARIAIDDYGTGHFEESDIKRIQPQYVKLAMPRVRAAASDYFARRWLLNAIKLCESVNAETIAEGVEGESELRLLRPMGVHFFQGYYWGLPSHLLPARRHSLPFSERESSVETIARTASKVAGVTI